MLRNTRRFAAALPLVLAASAALAQPSEVKSTLDAIFDQQVFARGMHGCVVRTLDTGRTVYSRNPDTLLNTASNMKLLTSASAIERLGPDYRYKTRLLASQTPDASGTVQGDLFLAGSGDPILETKALSAMVEEAIERGLKRVTGAVVGDTGAFDRSPYGWGWSWDYLDDYYAAPAGGLNLDWNVARIMVRPGAAPGAPARVTLEPSSPTLRVVNRVVTGSPSDKFSISREREYPGWSIIVSGTIPAGADEARSAGTVAVVDPAEHAAWVLRGLLQSAGVTVEGRARKGSAHAGAVELASHQSAPMNEIIVKLNKPSDNLIAECLLRTLGAEGEGSGSVSAGRRAAYAFLKGAGLDMDGVNMADGSGLSRMDMVTAENFVRLLEYMHKSKNGPAWKNSLPVAGVDGTLRSRMKGSPAEKNVTAKTGYIGYVSSLSGYVTTAAGQPLAFSILFNNQLGGVTPCLVAERSVCAYLAGLNEKL